MLTVAIFGCAAALLVIVWYEDFCPHCRRHALSEADVGLRCERCGWFER